MSGLIVDIPTTPAEQAALAVQLGSDAQTAARTLAVLSTAAKDAALEQVKQQINIEKDAILEANAKDIAAARASGTPEEIIARIDLGARDKFAAMLDGVQDVIGLADPVGLIDRTVMLDDGLVLRRSSCPIGVFFTIFEARPEVLVNITCLGLKSGNAVILKGGSEASHSLAALAVAIRTALTATAISPKAVQIVVGDRAQAGPVVDQLLTLDRYIDLVIPRGSAELVAYVKRKSQISVLGHADGRCIAYLKADCDKDLAVGVVHDSKTSYPAACNSLESLLVDSDTLAQGGVFEAVAQKLLESKVTLYCDAQSKEAALRVAGDYSNQVQDAKPEHYNTEFLSLKLAVKTIAHQSDSDDDAALLAAIEHINTHSSHHTDLILTSKSDLATRFFAAIDSSGVYWNASTRMADGNRYGFGAEVGISTNKIHARGPVGLDGLTIYKWLLCGQGQKSADYGPGGRKWRHEKIEPRGLDDLFAEK